MLNNNGYISNTSMSYPDEFVLGLLRGDYVMELPSRLTVPNDNATFELMVNYVHRTNIKNVLPYLDSISFPLAKPLMLTWGVISLKIAFFMAAIKCNNLEFVYHLINQREVVAYINVNLNLVLKKACLFSYFESVRVILKMTTNDSRSQLSSELIDTIIKRGSPSLMALFLMYEETQKLIMQDIIKWIELASIHLKKTQLAWQNKKIGPLRLQKAQEMIQILTTFERLGFRSFFASHVSEINLSLLQWSYEGHHVYLMNILLGLDKVKEQLVNQENKLLKIAAINKDSCLVFKLISISYHFKQQFIQQHKFYKNLVNQEAFHPCISPSYYSDEILVQVRESMQFVHQSHSRPLCKLFNELIHFNFEREVLGDSFFEPLKDFDNWNAFIIQEKSKVWLSEGQIHQEYPPYQTIQIILSLISYNEGYLKNLLEPKIEFEEGFIDSVESWKKSHTPLMWMKNNCEWYSQILIKKLGETMINQYLKIFNYGNYLAINEKPQTLEHPPSTRKLLTISPFCQINYLEKLNTEQLPITQEAQKMTKNLLFLESLDNDWELYGKVGNGWRLHDAQVVEPKEPVGWFIGWAQKAERKITFVRYLEADKKDNIDAGLYAKKEVVRKLKSILQL